jgi:hypothetical protein
MRPTELKMQPTIPLYTIQMYYGLHLQFPRPHDNEKEFTSDNL